MFAALKENTREPLEEKNTHFFLSWHKVRRVGDYAQFSLLTDTAGGLRLEHKAHFNQWILMIVNKLSSNGFLSLLDCTCKLQETFARANLSSLPHGTQMFSKPTISHRAANLDSPYQQLQLWKMPFTCDYLRSSSNLCWAYPKLVLWSSGCSTSGRVQDIWQLRLSVWLPETSRGICQKFCNKLQLEERV